MDVLAYELPPIKPSAFHFQPTAAAARHNMDVITSHGSVQAALESETNSPLCYGSEFRPTRALDKLMCGHPLWPKTKSIMETGTIFPLRPINDQLREQDLRHNLAYKNHKSAGQSSSLAKHMSEEIKHGWSLPLPPEFAKDIKDAEVAPHGMVQQNTITALGEIVEKERVTHDQSFPGHFSHESINSRTIEEDLAPCLFGHMCKRVIHYIVGCRQRHPSTKIWISKIDWKSAYRRQHLNHKTAVKSLTQVFVNGVWILLMALRLTFGGKPCPSEFGCISEPVTDLATDILNCEDWDPSILHAPDQDSFPPPSSLNDDTPFAPAKQTIVSIPREDKGTCDVYLDDMVAAGPDLPGNARRLEAAIPLSIHTICRPIMKSEPIPRKAIISANKLKAEGALEETKLLLGWLLDTRRLQISLPNDKFKAWSDNINDLLATKQATHPLLDKLVGRLNHVGYIIPTARHFLSRIRRLKRKAKFKRKVSIPALVLADLELWLLLLSSANEGISMNLVTYRQPSHLFRSDACEHGLGGYSADGLAWRWPLPTHLLSRAHINLLEFMASIICIWLDILKGNVPPQSCILSMGDSTTATGWLRKSNFQEENEDDTDTTAKLVAARHLASLIQGAEACLYAQWFKGEDNDVSDSLSRDLHISPPDLLHLLHSFFPSQVPNNFRIVDLPSEIVSWASSLLASLPVKKARLVKHKTTKLGAGTDGSNSSKTSNTMMTPTSLDSTNLGAGPFSSVPLPKPCERPATLASLSAPWLKAQSEPPSITWHRPSGLVTGLTHGLTTAETLTGFYDSSTKGTKTLTKISLNKKLSH